MWQNVQSVFETGWTTVRNWCPRTSVHQAGTRVKTWCLPPLLHEIFFCAREIGVAHSWAKLYVATTGDHAWCFNKTEDRFVFLRSIWGICVTSLLYSSLFFFYISSIRKNFQRGITRLRKQRWKFSNCSFVFFFFLFLFLSKIVLKWMEDTSESSMYDFIVWKWSMKKSFARIEIDICKITGCFLWF